MSIFKGSELLCAALSEYCRVQSSTKIIQVLENCAALNKDSGTQYIRLP